MKRITVKSNVMVSAKRVWSLWSDTKHIVKWNTPSADWHTTHAENDLRVTGRFLSRMEAKDGSFGFDFSGRYDEVIPHKRIAYTLDDGRKVVVDFIEGHAQTEIISTFDAEQQNSIEMQRAGWQAISDNFKRYAENISEH